MSDIAPESEEMSKDKQKNAIEEVQDNESDSENEGDTSEEDSEGATNENQNNESSQDIEQSDGETSDEDSEGSLYDNEDDESEDIDGESSDEDAEVLMTVSSRAKSIFFSDEESPEEKVDSKNGPPRRSERQQNKPPLLYHQIKHAKKFCKLKNRKFVCPNCTFSFSSNEILANHLMICEVDSDEENNVENGDPEALNQTRMEEQEQLSQAFKYCKQTKRDFLCLYCAFSFSSEKVLEHHIQTQHEEDSSSDEESSSGVDGENFGGPVDEPIACRNLPIPVDKPSTSSVVKQMETSTRQTAADELERKSSERDQKPIISSNLFKCSFCGKMFVNIAFLNKHELTHQPPEAIHSCTNCGEVLKSLLELAEHEKICFEPAEANGGIEFEHVSNDMNDVDNGDCGPPPAKRPLLDLPSETVREEQPMPTHISMEQYPARTIAVKQEVEDTELVAGIANGDVEDPAVASTPSYDPSRVKVEDDNEIIVVFDKKETTQNHKVAVQQALLDSLSVVVRRPDTSSQTSLVPSLDGLSTCSRHPARIESRNSTIAPEKVQKNTFPLCTAIMTRAIPNELLIIWVEKLDDDLILAVKSQSNNSILLIKELDTVNLSIQQKNLINKSNHFTFNLLDDDKTSSLWTVISFGEGNSPKELNRRIFKTFAAVETVLLKHAEERGKTLHHVMRHSKDELLPQLSASLQKRITAYNYQS